jgi:epsin
MDIIQDPPKPDTFDFTSLNAPLQSIDTTQPTQKPTVEESFLGTNATLVNLDTLIAPLPPPTSINPFGISTTPPINRANNNPFDVNKPPAPTLAQLQQGPTFDPLPPPLLPVNDTTKDPFNPFS